MRLLLLIVLLLIACNGELPTESRIGCTIPRGPANVRGVVLWRNIPHENAQINIGAHQTTTDNSGSFVIENVASGSHNLSVASAGAGPTTIGDIFLVRGPNELRIQHSRGYPDGYLFGRILDSCSGAPIIEAEVSLGVQGSTRSLPDASYVLLACCNTLPSLTVRASGYKTYSRSGFGRLYGRSVSHDVLLERD